MIPEALPVHISLLKWGHIKLTGDNPWKRFLPNHHCRASGANDGGSANARTGTDYHSSNSGDSSADSSHRSIQDTGPNRLVRPICQSNRQPSISGARKRRVQAPTKPGENIFS